MCEYVYKNELKDLKKKFKTLINKVHKYLRKNYKITFSCIPIGSGKRNMVIKQCNKNYFDLDFQIILQSVPDEHNSNDSCKALKDLFRSVFDKFKLPGFSDCEDSTQALTIKNVKGGYGFDIVITKYDSNANFYILYNKKNTNAVNNKDYEWAIRRKMNKYQERLKCVKGAEMWKYLRDIYLKKRHEHKDDNSANKKISYQLLNEAVVETLKHFKKEIDV